jgi:ATP-binding cassette subfamily B protein
MNDASKSEERPWSRLPAELAARLQAGVDPGAVTAVAPFDLDSQGRYAEGYLLLADDRLGHYLRRDGRWDGGWIPLKTLQETRIVDGLGMSVLRLLADKRAVAEFRFTLRYARDVAKLHRRLDRQVQGKTGPAEPEERRPDEKKIRCEKCDRVIPPWSEVCPACLSRRKVLSRLLDFVRPYRWQAVGGFAMAVLGTLFGLVRPYLTQPMMDQGLGLGPGRQADYRLLLVYVGLMAALTVLSSIADSIRARLMAMLGSRISRDIRDRTYAHLHTLSLSFFSKKPTGSLVTRVTSDSDRIWDFVAFTLIELSIAVMTIAGVGVALFVLNWRLACIVLLPVPVMFGITLYFHRRLHAGFDRLFHKWSVLTATVADALPGVRVIKAFSQEKHEIRRFGARNQNFYKDEVGMITMWTLFGPLMSFCSQVGTILVWLVGGYWVVRGRMSAGTLMAYTGYMWMFYGPIHMIAHMDRMFNRAATSVQRIFEILDTAPVVFSRPSPHRPDCLRGRIELRGVSFSYDGVRKVLEDVNLTVEPGEMIGLAGPSGGGKTTMVNLICRFYDVLEGQILIDGVDLRDYDVEELRRRIGVVLQEPFLFHGTVAQNIAYGRPEATTDQVIAAARVANAHEFIVRFSDGYDTLVGERGHTLSGGERQRISIARAILTDPPILILDEATSSVDTETEKLIQEALDRLVARRTTIAIAHRLSTLRKAGRLVILDKGKIVEQGTHEQLLAQEGGSYAKLIRLQSELHAVMAIG